MEIRTKPMPHDVEAEQAVLGSMFFGTDAVLQAMESLVGDDFYAPVHRTIYQSMTELFSQGSPMDIITLKAKLEEKSLLETIGGMDYVLSLASSMSTWANMKHHIKIVENKSMLRKFIKATASISAKCYEQSHSVEEIAGAVESEIFPILISRNTGFVSPAEWATSVVLQFEELSKSKDKISGLETGFTDFDSETSGLQPGNLIIIAARPSMGKSTLAVNIAHFVTSRRNIPVAFFSLEMKAADLDSRLFSGETRIDSQKLRSGDLKEEDWIKIIDSTDSLSTASLYIYDSSNVNISKIRSMCRKLKLEKGLGLIIVDYLQLMSVTGRTGNREQEIAQISRNLRALAGELNVPVIALSQLNRGLESRSDKRPMLADLRESGALEQDADMVVFLHRKGYYNPQTENPNSVELIIKKQRNGATGTVHLTWLPQYTKFEDAEY